MSPENKLIVLYLFTIAKSGHKQHKKRNRKTAQENITSITAQENTVLQLCDIFFMSEHNA